MGFGGSGGYPPKAGRLRPAATRFKAWAQEQVLLPSLLRRLFDPPRAALRLSCLQRRLRERRVFDCPALEAFIIEERVLCPERPKASVGYEATIAGCRGQDSREEAEF